MKLPEMTPERRRWVYRVAVAALAVAAAYGLVDPQTSQAWDRLLAAITGVAAAAPALAARRVTIEHPDPYNRKGYRRTPTPPSKL